MTMRFASVFNLPNIGNYKFLERDITKDNLEIISSYKRIQGNESEKTDILNVSVNF